jgi:hypothetical protein
MHIHNEILVLFTECLLHVSALTAPSSGRSLITSQNHLLIVCYNSWVAERGICHMWSFTQLFTIIKTLLGPYDLIFLNIKNCCLKLHDNLKSSWKDGGSTSLCLVSVSFHSIRPLFTLFLHCWLPFVSSYWLLSPCASCGLCYLISLISHFSLFFLRFLS